MNRHLSHVLAAVLAATAIAAPGSACSNPFGKACTQIGCGDGLRVTFEAPPPAGTVVELYNATGVVWRVECGVDWFCDTGIFFADYSPDQVEVRVATAAGEVTKSFQPRYEELQPNGDGCPPTCRVATVLMDLPG